MAVSIDGLFSIPDLPAAVALAETDLFHVNQNAIDGKLSLLALTTYMMDKAHPVGEIFLSSLKGFNPNTRFPGQTWVRLSAAEGRQLRICAANETDLGTTGGADSLTITAANLPAHTHTVSGTTDAGGAHTPAGSIGNSGAHTHSVSGSTGAAGKHTPAGSIASNGAHTHTVSGSTGNAGGFTPAGSIASNGAHTHTVSGSAASGGAHTHTISGTAASAGNHSHAQRAWQNGGGGSGWYIDRNVYNISGNVNTQSYTVDAGAHTHSVSGSAASGGAHTHTVSGTAASAGAHSHTFTGTAVAAHSHSVSGTAASAGAHSHTFTGTEVGDHTHTVSGTAAEAGTHNHTFTGSLVAAHTHTFSATTGSAYSGTPSAISTAGAWIKYAGWTRTL